MRHLWLTTIAVSLLPFAGQGLAGERQGDATSTDVASFDAASRDVVIAAVPVGQALVSEYRIDDAQGGHGLTVIRSHDKIEYRRAGLPIRVWRNVADGVELRELDQVKQVMTTYSPGDLRALNSEPEWSVLAKAQMPPCADQTTSCGWRLINAHLASDSEAFTSTQSFREVDGIDSGD